MSDSNLKIDKLAGSSNWNLWSIRMEAVLIEKGYYEVMTTDPSTINNDDDNAEEKAKYYSLALKATAQIRLALGNGPLIQTRNITNPYTLWAVLANLYEPKGFSSEFLICKELFSTTLKKSANLEAYLSKIKQLTDDLKIKELEIPTKVVIAWVLNNLTPDYDYTVAIITQSMRKNSKNSITLEDIFSYLLDESRRLNSKSLDKSNSELALATSNNSNNSNSNSKNKWKNSKNSKYCTHCDKNGHTKDRCFILHPELKPEYKKQYNSANNTIKSDSISETALITSKLDKEPKSNTRWILDSGASVYICSNKALFESLRPSNSTIRWGNNDAEIRATGEGTIRAIFSSTNKNVVFNKVLFIPELGVNLLSLGLIKDKDFNVKFTKNSCIIYSNNFVLARGLYANNLSIFETTNTTNTSKNIVLNTTSNSLKTWHTRLGHIGSNALSKLSDNTKGITDFSTKEFSTKECPICIEAKLTKKVNKNPNPESEILNLKYLDKIYSDIGGPIAPITNRGYKYYITLIDAKTKYLHVFLLKTRDEIRDIIPNFIKQEENQFDTKVKQFYSDNAKEYLALTEYFIKKGIIYNTSAPYSPEMNGRAERINRTLFNKVRALIIESNLAKKYWGDAILSATYLYNRTPNSTIEYKTPYELKYGYKPSIKNIKIWGSLAYKREPTELITKLDPRAKPFYIIGYDIGQYKLLDPKTTKVVWARDVAIIEGSFWKPSSEYHDDSQFLIDFSDFNTPINSGDFTPNSKENMDPSISKDLLNIYPLNSRDNIEPDSTSRDLLDNISNNEEEKEENYLRNLFDEIQEYANISVSNYKEPTSYKNAILDSKALE